jgi:hypothetical protein
LGKVWDRSPVDRAFAKKSERSRYVLVMITAQIRAK